MNRYKYKEDAKGIIINIKHGALKEGPGWRSIVYFKGCNFSACALHLSAWGYAQVDADR